MAEREARAGAEWVAERGGSYQGPGRSPDRADACIWALTELLLGAPPPEPRVRGF